MIAGLRLGLHSERLAMYAAPRLRFGEIVAAAGRGATPLQTSPQVFEYFLAPGSPGREWGRMLGLHIQDAGE